jgi:hypothetical protein
MRLLVVSNEAARRLIADGGRYQREKNALTANILFPIRSSTNRENHVASR